ncbi:hypothetical protein ACFP81_04930 [Deinococcus lacus]|uniref:Lipoprotein n=1 Tax=Deinococcus lacus TaxID=392561 RepID=A0ABW1YB35_9DEIO
MSCRWLTFLLPALLTACAPAEREDAQVWPAPASAPAWQDYELAGVGGVGIRGATAETWLVLRCAARPERRLEREYWPGADWAGGPEWGVDAVTYQPGRTHPQVRPFTFTLEEAQRLGCRH